MSDLYAQYGCGHSAPAGWRNFDASPTLWVERLPVVGRWYTKNATRFPENVEFGDIVKGLPLGSESCAGVYCSHVLEHLALQEFRIALRNTYRILRPGAPFRFVLPDLEHSIAKYAKDASQEAAMEFLRETGLGRETRPHGIAGLVVSHWGHSSHLWMWDYKAIVPELAQAGFVGVRRAAFNDSADSRFVEVEEKSRWEDCLGIECRRPA